MKLKDLLKNIDLDYKWDADLNKELIPTTKTDNIQENSILFIYKRIDGSPSIKAEDISNKPYAIVCDTETEGNLCESVIYVDNVRLALAFAFSEHYCINYDELTFIGVTGTNGKTTTATLLYSILSNEEKSGFIGTGKIICDKKELSNSEYTMTTPDPELLYKIIKEMQNYGCKYIVMEVSSHALGFYKVDAIPFKLSLFTNLSSEHMDFHKTVENYFNSKCRLFNLSEKCIFNIDDSYGKVAYKKFKEKAISVGIIANADISAVSLESKGLHGSSYYYKKKGLIFKTELRLPGPYNIYNALLATTAAIELGLLPCKIKRYLSDISIIEGRLEEAEEGSNVFIDYAHTPLALENLLVFVNTAKETWQKVVVVFGCGGERDKSKRCKMGKIASEYADLIILTEDNSRNEKLESILLDIEKGIVEGTEYKIIKSRKEAIETAIFETTEHDIVLIVGKGHERYIIDNSGKHPFDERKIIKEALYRFRGEKNEN